MPFGLIMKISFLLYPTASVKVDEDSSFWIIHELLRRGHEVRTFESRDLFWSEGVLYARLTAARTDARKGFLRAVPDATPTPLASQQAVFIRKEPPFTTEYLYALQLLERLRGRVFVLNDPAGIALWNEKLSILRFPEFVPETCVTSQPSQARAFVRSLGARVVVKTLDNKAGTGIYLTGPRDKNLPTLLDQATAAGQRSVMVQRYLPHDKKGDKRILVLDGEPVGCFVRRPSAADFRANLSVGGSMHRAALDKSDERMLRAVSPALVRDGIFFAGLDVIAGRLTEINVTSPSGIPELHRLEGLRLEKNVADLIERRLRR
jgi:glutathione synthase